MEHASDGRPEPSSSSGDGRLDAAEEISQEEDESTYDSGESDDRGTIDTKSDEDKSYQDDDESHSSHYSDFSAAEDPRRDEFGDVEELEAGMTAMTAATAAPEDPAADMEPSASTYSYGDDFVDEDTSVSVKPSLSASTLERGHNRQEKIHPVLESFADPGGAAGSRAEAMIFPQNRLDDKSRISFDESAGRDAIEMADDDRRPPLVSRCSEDGGNAFEGSKALSVNDLGRAQSESILVEELEGQLQAAGTVTAKLDAKISENHRKPDEELERLRGQIEAARAMIMSSLDLHDDGDDTPKSLVELVLLAESQGYTRASRNASQGAKGVCDAPSTTLPTNSIDAESDTRGALELRVKELEEELARTCRENREHLERADSFQRKLEGCRYEDTHGAEGRGAELATADILALKAKATQLVERLRQEKMARLKAERDTQNVAEKVQVLSDHIEKLMVFLKHEATQKTKAHEQQRRLQKELELVKARGTALLRNNQAKDRVMTELKEGSNILEDQLRLMDEKYMELRTKLDWTRQKAGKEVRRARAQASALRTKWALLCREGKCGENSLLDCVELDVAPASPGHTASVPARTGQIEGAGAPKRGKSTCTASPTTGIGNFNGDCWLGTHAYAQQHQEQQRRAKKDTKGNSVTGGAKGDPTSRMKQSIGSDAPRDGKSRDHNGSKGQGQGLTGPGTTTALGRAGLSGDLDSSFTTSGRTMVNPSDAAKLSNPRRGVTTSGGNMGVARGARGGAARGGSPNGISFAPVLSAGSDPGGGMLGSTTSSGGRGAQRSPWGEQGNARAATAAASGSGTPQILFA